MERRLSSSPLRGGEALKVTLSSPDLLGPLQAVLETCAHLCALFNSATVTHSLSPPHATLPFVCERVCPREYSVPVLRAYDGKSELRRTTEVIIILRARVLTTPRNGDN